MKSKGEKMAKTSKPVKSKNNLTGIGLALMAFTGV